MKKRLVVALAAIAAFTAPTLMAGEIVHDAEQQILGEQFGEEWAAQDIEI